MVKTTHYEKVGPEFLTSKKSGTIKAAFDHPAKTVFDALKSDAAWKAMLPVDVAEWHGPLGPETRRTISANGSGVLEQFFEWKEGRSFAFYLESGSVGILKALAERYDVLPITQTTSELTLTYRIQTKGLAKPLGPVLMMVFKIAGRKSMKNLANYIAETA